MIGLMLYHSNDYVIDVVDVGILSHAINYWLVEDDHFIKSKLTPLSKQFDKGFIEILFQMLLEKQQITKKEYDSLICALNRKFNIN